MNAVSQFFTKELLTWHEENPREMPWHQEKDPYKIWISEIILQQTRVNQAWDYYIKFVSTYPDVHTLANSNIEDVLNTWEGLGYYSRARNLHAAARYIVKEYQGIFPNQYDDILKLKGVGPYTAAAISSFAYDLPYPVLDGNVYRVISRYFGIEAAIDTGEGKSKIQNHIQNVFAKKESARFNQAIMNFGALVCTPKNSACSQCPLGSKCVAYKNNLVEILPYKSKRIKRRTRWFHYFYINVDEKIVIHQRNNNDIWKKMYQLPLLEASDDKDLTFDQILPFVQKICDNNKPSLQLIPMFTDKQILTHQTIQVSFHLIIMDTALKTQGEFFLVSQQNLTNFAFPKIIRSNLEKLSTFIKTIE